MANNTNGFRWDYDRIRPSLKSGEQKAHAYLGRITTYHALRGETFAKTTAKWRDRTSNARGGLTGVAESKRDEYKITISHSMNYGIWLEIRFAGRYAIINPTIQHEAPIYFDTAFQLLDKMFGQGE